MFERLFSKTIQRFHEKMGRNEIRRLLTTSLIGVNIRRCASIVLMRGKANNVLTLGRCRGFGSIIHLITLRRSDETSTPNES